MSRSGFALAVALALAAGLAPRASQASGGVFGDVEQSRDRIIFWVDRSGSEPYLETHIQMHYEGDAESFAWIIPVPEVPEVSVGSQGLFDFLLVTTAPEFEVNESDGYCPGPASCLPSASPTPDGGEWSDDDGDWWEDGESEGGWKYTPHGDSGEPSIQERGTAGAFEYVTLSGGSTQEILDWLDANGFAQDPDAAPILDDYVQEGFAFVAVRLAAGTDVSETHPLVIRHPGATPRIPIRLTSIAAIEEMPIRALFLGNSRVAPTNWPHVVVNPSRYAWSGDSNYDEIVGLALDEAGGRAFVTEYGGLGREPNEHTRIRPSWWDAAVFEDMAPELAITELDWQDFISCNLERCTMRHPLIRGLLQKYLPPPDGVEAEVFWACLSCYVEQIDPVAWSAQPGFAAELEALIIAPGQHGLDMLEGSFYVTRLYTRLSPHEMTEDPLFHETEGLDKVSASNRAYRRFDCKTEQRSIGLPDDRELLLLDNWDLPHLPDNPAALRIERIPMTGPPTIEVDNGPLIDELFAAYHEPLLVGPTTGNYKYECSSTRVGFETVFTFFAIFGIAWFNRGSRRQRGLT